VKNPRIFIFLVVGLGVLSDGRLEQFDLGSSERIDEFPIFPELKCRDGSNPLLGHNGLQNPRVFLSESL